MVVGALLAGAVQVPGLVSTERTRASQSALAGGEAHRALDLADQAIQAEGWAASPYAARAVASEQLGNLSGAKHDAQEAIDREPDNWRYRLVIARIEAEAGQLTAARAEIATARRLAPRYAYLDPGSPSMLQLNSLLRAKPTTTSSRASAGP